MTVGLVIVSHSEQIAEGVVELAGQMAPDIVIVAAGGIEDGGTVRIGTSFERVQEAIERALSAEGAVILTDLGSAVMTAESVLDFMEPADRERVRLAEAALVEGAVAAAVQAQGGSSLDEVLRAAEGAVVPRTEAAPADAPVDAGVKAGAEASGSWTLRNQTGLHARPAAALATGLLNLDADVQINGVDGKSVVLLMTLGLGQGKTLTAEATGPDARAAVDFIGEAVESGFGEAQ